ncbi:MAG: hypothetical protein WKF83_14400 [Nocardioidaceae bacterium]
MTADRLFRVAAIQMNTRDEKHKNVERALELDSVGSIARGQVGRSPGELQLPGIIGGTGRQRRTS